MHSRSLEGTFSVGAWVEFFRYCEKEDRGTNHTGMFDFVLGGLLFVRFHLRKKEQ